MYRLLERTYRGYITHPNVAAALLLEHGCEKLPNDVMRRQLENAAVPLSRFGWASVQLDGGIAKALDKIEAWFTEKLAALPPPQTTVADLGALNLGLMTSERLSNETVGALIVLAEMILGSGGSVLIPESDPLLADLFFPRALLGKTAPHATLAYGQPLTTPGFHIVATETDHWVENLTGLGGCGAHLALTFVTEHARQGHPLLPVAQVAETSHRGVIAEEDIDLFLSGGADERMLALQKLVVAVAQREHMPVANAQGFVDFQLTRGLLGVTT
jgi:altronate dehydratase